MRAEPRRDIGRPGAKRTILTAFAAWVVYRVARRALKVAALVGILAAGVGLAKSRGVDLSGVGRVATCEIPALIAGAAKLPQLLAPSPPGSKPSTPPLADELARCQPHSPPASHPQAGRR